MDNRHTTLSEEHTFQEIFDNPGDSGKVSTIPTAIVSPEKAGMVGFRHLCLHCRRYRSIAGIAENFWILANTPEENLLKNIQCTSHLQANVDSGEVRYILAEEFSVFSVKMKKQRNKETPVKLKRQCFALA